MKIESVPNPEFGMERRKRGAKQRGMMGNRERKTRQENRNKPQVKERKVQKSQTV